MVPHPVAIFACWICHVGAPSHLALAATTIAQRVLAPEEPRPADMGATPPALPVRRVALPDPVVVGVLDASRSAFQACVRRAARLDPNVVTLKIQLTVEIDAAGAVTASTANVDDIGLRACVARVGRSLHFPAPGQPATAALVFFGS